MTGSIIYISSNKEDLEFSEKIVKDMLSKKGDLPVFSVTQEPMNPDFNMIDKVVGNIGASGFNFCRQLQMVLELSDTDYVIECEADNLYPPDYFTFVPPSLDAVYRNTNNYVIGYKKDYYSAKKSSTGFQVAGRKFLLDRLNFLLKGQPQWSTEMKNFPKEINQPFLEGWETFKTEYACLSFKTGKGMRLHSASGSTEVYSLPYWNKASDLRKEYGV